MKKTSEKKDARKPSASFVIGAIALVFLIIGYQVALFVHHAAVTRIVAHHDRPDTVFIVTGKDSLPPHAYSGSPSAREPKGTAGSAQYRRDADHSPAARQIRLQYTPRRYECFRFDPNTVSVEDLMRLGFSLKQAQAIDNYRQKGGRYRRKSDFAKSFVVADSVYRRLAPYIDIPAIDLNTADSAAFETLPGIGKYFAARMVSYREELGGYSYPEQLMDIRHFDQEKFDGLKDLVTLGEQKPYPLWTLPEERLRTHPYIGKYAARGIVLFRENNPRDRWSVENLIDAGILDPERAPKLARCRIADP
jgi:DNA uptake protein ComE-like DNA-binding protein